jgi:hypothetical protein
VRLPFIPMGSFSSVGAKIKPSVYGTVHQDNASQSYRGIQGVCVLLLIVPMVVYLGVVVMIRQYGCGIAQVEHAYRFYEDIRIGCVG